MTKTGQMIKTASVAVAIVVTIINLYVMIASLTR